MKIKLDPMAWIPERAHNTDAGLDLKSPIDITVPARGSTTIDTGVHIQLPPGTAGMLKSKSGLNVKHGITSEGVIDEGYTGSIVVKLYNHTFDDYHVSIGDKVSQLVVIPVLTPEMELVDELNGGERGENGFGRTER